MHLAGWAPISHWYLVFILGSAASSNQMLFSLLQVRLLRHMEMERAVPPASYPHPYPNITSTILHSTPAGSYNNWNSRPRQRVKFLSFLPQNPGFVNKGLVHTGCSNSQRTGGVTFSMGGGGLTPIVCRFWRYWVSAALSFPVATGWQWQQVARKWRCVRCTFDNEPMRRACELCGAAKHAGEL